MKPKNAKEAERKSSNRIGLRARYLDWPKNTLEPHQNLLLKSRNLEI